MPHTDTQPRMQTCLHVHRARGLGGQAVPQHVSVALEDTHGGAQVVGEEQGPRKLPVRLPVSAVRRENALA